MDGRVIDSSAWFIHDLERKLEHTRTDTGVNFHFL